MPSDLFFRMRSLLRRKTVEAELEQELDFHRERQLERYVSAGLTHGEAARRMRMQFGGLDQVKDECRDARGVGIFENLLQDLRYGLRVLRKARGFTTIALLTLALGIGMTTALFSVLYAVLLRPLPYKDASRLIVLNETTPRVGQVSVSYPNFLDWRAQNRSFVDLAAVSQVGFNLSGIDHPESIMGQAVSPNFLSLLGVHPLLGRDFDSSEDKPGSSPVVLLSYALWQSRFGGDRGVVGRTIALDGRGYTVIGVLAPNFRWFEKTDVLEPIGVWAGDNPAYKERGERGDMVALGRLAPGSSFAEAQAEMKEIAARLAQAYPASNDQCGAALRPIRDVFVSEIRPAVLVLFAAAFFVLLIACANVANLFLMRGMVRGKELSLRIAIGASGRRIMAQLIAESLLLTSLGGVAGVVIAFAVIRAVGHLIPADVLAGAEVEINAPALLFAAGVVALSAIVFGVMPGVASREAHLHSELKQGGHHSSAAAAPSHGRAALVIAEVALALILLMAAGLMTKSLYRLFSVDPGVRTEHLLTMQLSLRTAQYDRDPAIVSFWTRLLDGVRRLPGIEAAAAGTNVPLTDDHWRTDITVEGMALPKPGSFPHPDTHIVSPGYLDTLGIQLLRGRAFTELDTGNAPRVALVNSRFARQFFGSADPVGKRFMFGRPRLQEAPKWVTIAGVVGDTKLYGLQNPSRLEVYVPLRQSPAGSMTLIVKSQRDPAELVSEVRKVVASIDKDQPVFAIATMSQLVKNSVWTQHATFVLLGLFSALGLLLAAIGIYGVISYSVTQRAQEIGIRMALGAQPGEVLRMMMAQGAKIAFAGLLLGVAASAGLTRLMSKLLFAVSSVDPATFVWVTVVLAVIALFASYIPARRTSRVDPMSTLRCE